MSAYYIMQGGSLILAFTAVWWLAPRHDPALPRQEMLAIFGASAFGGGLGGRLLWWLASWLRGERMGIGELLALPDQGGFSSLGVLAGAAAFATVMILLGGLRKRFWHILDFFAPIFLIALAIARLGCLVRGCDFGVEMPADHSLLTTRYEEPGAFAWQWFAARRELELDGTTPALFALPLWLSAVTFALVCLVLSVERWRSEVWRAGTRALTLMGGYVVLRFVLEGWRHPATQSFIAPGVHLSVSRAALLAIGMVVIGMALWRRKSL